MTNIRDVLYLFDIDGVPLRSVREKYDLSVERIANESDVLTLSVPHSPTVEIEQQLVWHGERFIITNYELSRVKRNYDIIAEAAYMSLSEDLCTIDVTASTVTQVLTAILKGTKWTPGDVASTQAIHSMKLEDVNILGALRQLAELADLTLTFDTVNYKVNYVHQETASVVFKHGKNIAEYSRIENAPVATVVYPVGADGLNIKSVNGGVSYIENYDYYMSKGYTLAQARTLFRKVGTFEDDSHIYAGTLMRAAERWLAKMSKPQKTYQMEASILPDGVKIGQPVFIEDDVSGYEHVEHVVRMVEYEDRTKNTVELGYLIPGLPLTGGGSGISSSGGMQTVMAKSKGAFIGNQTYQQLISVTFSNTASLNAQVFINLRGNLSADAILEAIIEVDGQPVPDYKITQVMIKGPQSSDYNFIITQIQEGSHTMRVLLRTSAGSFTAKPNEITMSVQAENLAGGTGSDIPEINIIDDVILPSYISVTETCVITLEESPVTG